MTKHPDCEKRCQNGDLVCSSECKRLMQDKHPRPAFDEPACDNHPTLAATNCSTWGIRRFLCDECIAAIRAQPKMPNTDPQWLRELRTGNPGETIGMEGREAGHAYMTRIAKEKPE